MDIQNIKQECLEEGYDLVIGCNGWEEYITSEYLKTKIIQLIEEYEPIN